jgi:flavorubredoxin
MKAMGNTMAPFEIKKDIFWVGSVDWNSRDFHGYSLSPRGTTYNSYLLRGEKNVLFDTVKSEACGELLCNISQVMDPADIDYIVVNHLEPDHSGCLPEIVAAAQPEKIFCSPPGHRALDAHFHNNDWPVQTVKTGDIVDLGSKSIHFLETRMVHWPDSMASYIPEDKLLICNDAFGQNIASTERFADQINHTVLDMAMKEYYGNIVLPFSPLVIKILDKIAQMGLDVDMLAPDHGLIFRGDDVAYAFDSYRKFAEQKPTRKAVIAFDSMWKSTEQMAKALASGLNDEGVESRIMWLKANHHSAIMAETLEAGIVAVGSPTHNNNVMPLVASLLTFMQGLRPKNKIGIGFGSYGWSGEAPRIIQEWLGKMHMNLPCDQIKALHVPTHQELKACSEMGRTLARALKEVC